APFLARWRPTRDASFPHPIGTSPFTAVRQCPILSAGFRRLSCGGRRGGAILETVGERGPMLVVKGGKCTTRLVVKTGEDNMALTVKRVEKLLRAGVPGKHTDTGDVRGLMLCIESKSSAHWLLRFQRAGRVRHMGLGSARDVPLAAARTKARRERERLADGVDPLAVKHAERATAAAAAARKLTFKEAAERCHEALAAGWSNPHHANEFISSLRRWVYPHIGNLDVAAVGKDEVLRVLEQRLPDRIGKGTDGSTFWVAHSQTADRTRNRIQRVLDWAEARGFRPAGTPNPARWAGFLDQLLAKPRKIA